VSYRRKVRESDSGYRIRGIADAKEENSRTPNSQQIFLRSNAYGVQAAAQALFWQRNVRRACPARESPIWRFCPKGPSNYRRKCTNSARITKAQPWVLGEMRDNGWITFASISGRNRAAAGCYFRRRTRFETGRRLFFEECGRQLIEQLGRE